MAHSPKRGRSHGDRSLAPLRVALVRTKPTPRGDYLLHCFQTGVISAGDRCIEIDDIGKLKHLRNADLAVQVCLANRWHAGGESGNLRMATQNHLRKRGKRFLVIDTAFVHSQSDYAHRGHMPKFDIDDTKTYAATDPHIYYEVAYDGIKGCADHCTEDVPGDRWHNLAHEMLPWRTQGDYILLLGQPLHGPSSQHVDIYRWYAQAIQTIRKVTQRPIVIRQHPRFVRHDGSTSARGASDRRKIEALSGRDLGWSKNRALADDLRGAWAAVTFSSNAAVMAVLMGVPLFASHKACIAWPVANHDLTKIEFPTHPKRTAWAHALAYSQWNPIEMRSGECWKRLRQFALQPPRKSELFQ